MDRPSDTLTLAERSDLAARARQLLAQQMSECDGLLAPLLRSTLDDLEQELFRIAEQSSGGQAQHEAMTALAETRRTRTGFHGRVMALLQRRFALIGRAPVDPHRDDQRRSADLSLVDPHEFDESMALDDLSTRTELHAGNTLFDLGHRYAVLIATPPLDNDALPCGPRSLATILCESATGFGLQRTHRLLFYRLCDRRMFAAAESLYTRLNEQLKEAGILPDLRSYLPHRAPRRRGGTQPASSAAAPEAQDSGQRDAPAADESAPATGPMTYVTAPPMPPATNFTAPPPPGAPAANLAAPFAPAASELHALLGARRHALHPEVAAAVAQSVEFASMPELQEALSALQAMPSASSSPHPGEQLASEVMDALRHAAPSGAPRRLQPEQRDALDLVGLLYDQLAAETRGKGVAQQLLGKLQVPLLRIALADRDFFTVRSHPARRLLNLVLETSNLWLDRSDEQFDSALNQRLQRSVQRIVDEFHGDIGVVEQEANSLDAHMKLLTRRAEIAERRQVEAAQGRDRLQAARAAAGKAMNERLAKDTAATPLVRTLLESAWTDALTLTLLREGEQSDAYRQRLGTADALLDPKPGRDKTRLAADLNYGLAQVGLQATEADQITRYALDMPQQATASTAPPPSQTELLVRLKSRRQPEEGEAPTAPATPRKLPLTHREKHALDELKALPFGTWLEFTVNQQGQTVARKLAWFAPSTGRCLLINARGSAASERDLEHVARLMARGQVRVMPELSAGLFDRAWGALVAGLRKFTGASTPPEGAT